MKFDLTCNEYSHGCLSRTGLKSHWRLHEQREVIYYTLYGVYKTTTAKDFQCCHICARQRKTLAELKSTAHIRR